MNSVIATGLILSLVVVTGFMGQVSVVQLALSGGAGFVMAHFDSNLGIGFPADAIVGVLVATIIGVGIGFSALRVRGVQLAVVTMAGAVAIQQFWFANATLGAGLSGANVAQPSLFGIQLGNQAPFRGLDGNIPSPILGFVVLALTIGLCLLVGHLRRTHVGQQMVVARANERAAAGVGINVRAVKLVAFTVGSFIAGVAGVMYAYNFGSISSNRFSAITALSLIAFAYVGGITMLSGAIIAGLISVEALIPYAWEKWLGLSGTWALLVGGVFLIFNLIFYPGGVAGTSYDKRRLKKRMASASRTPLRGRILAGIPGVRERPSTSSHE
jgi:branched-chain amino acid transport system permease protein